MCWVCEIKIWRSYIDDLNWLLVEESVDFTIIELAFNKLNKKLMQEHLRLKTNITRKFNYTNA